MAEKQKKAPVKIGEKGYINPNCGLVIKTRMPIFMRCIFCKTRFLRCSILYYIFFSLSLITLLLFFASITGEISKTLIFIVFISAIIYGYIFGKSTATLTEKSLAMEIMKDTLEEANSSLEIRVAAKTRALQDLANNLDKQVKEKTGELEVKINELERFNKLAIDREMKMIELKQENKKLKQKVQELNIANNS